MTLKKVILQINGKNFEKLFDRSKIRLGKVLYIKESESGNDLQISESEFNQSKKVAVSWIAPSVWAISLIEKYHLEKSEIEKIQTLLTEYLDAVEVERILQSLASKLRIEHLYKSSEYENSSLRVIFAVHERLQLVSSLKTKEIGEKLWHQWEPVISYHLLTCFDLLGQPTDWTTFESWLTSDSYLEERNQILSKVREVGNAIEITKTLHQEYLRIYGVKNSFSRFMRELLPERNRRELFGSIKIHTNSMPPLINTVSEDGTDEDKEKFLFNLRNNYAHKIKIIPGINSEMINLPTEYRNVFTMKNQVFKAETWVSYFTLDWPDVLEHIVRIGLAEYLKKQE